jgi:hypothetical protein
MPPTDEVAVPIAPEKRLVPKVFTHDDHFDPKSRQHVHISGDMKVAR